MRNPLAVSIDVDLCLPDIPLLNRRPDAVIYDASLPDNVVLRVTEPDVEKIVLAVLEVRPWFHCE